MKDWADHWVVSYDNLIKGVFFRTLTTAGGSKVLTPMATILQKLPRTRIGFQQFKIDGMPSSGNSIKDTKAVTSFCLRRYRGIIDRHNPDNDNNNKGGDHHTNKDEKISINSSDNVLNVPFILFDDFNDHQG